MTLEEARKLPEFAKVVYKGKTYDYGYVGQTGYLVLYEEGERNMQDSFAVPPEEVERRVRSKLSVGVKISMPPSKLQPSLGEFKAKLADRIRHWVSTQEDPSRIAFAFTDGRTFSAEDILREISSDSELGNEILTNWFEMALERLDSSFEESC